MSWVATAIVGGSVIGAIGQSKSAKSAATTQSQAAQQGIDEQRRQFDAVQALLKPYVEAGTGAIEQQGALIGLGGTEAQQRAIAALEAGPEYEALVRSGEEALLQQASATGGLRGGNIQAALAQYRPQVLSGLIGQQYDRLGGLARMGQASAAGQATFATNLGQQTAARLGDIGSARAGATMASGQAFGNLFGDLGMLGGRGLAYQGYTPPGASAPLTLGQAMFYTGKGF